MKILSVFNSVDRAFLLNKCEEVTDFEDPRLPLLIAALKDMMSRTNCVGLAAPQIGSNLRVIGVYLYGDKDPTIMINPKLEKKKGTIKWKEKCLSIPGFEVRTKRSREIYISFVAEHGEEFYTSYRDRDAVCIQHEIDHLDGVIMTKYGAPVKVRR